MWEKQMVAANDGNISLRTGENSVILTPTGVSKGDLIPDMLIKVDMAGNIMEGTLRPSSELQMHLNIYRNNPEIVSTCHAHCMFLSIFACAGIELDMATSPEPILISGKIPVVPYECPGTLELAKSIIPYVNDYSVVLLSNHGPISWGKTPLAAWHTLESAEAYAKSCMIIKNFFSDYRALSSKQIEKLEDRFHPIKEKNRVYCTEKETNRDPGRSYSDFNTIVCNLSEESLEKLANLVAKKLKGK